MRLPKGKASSKDKIKIRSDSSKEKFNKDLNSPLPISYTLFPKSSNPSLISLAAVKVKSSNKRQS